MMRDSKQMFSEFEYSHLGLIIVSLVYKQVFLLLNQHQTICLIIFGNLSSIAL